MSIWNSLYQKGNTSSFFGNLLVVTWSHLFSVIYIFIASSTTPFFFGNYHFFHKKFKNIDSYNYQKYGLIKNSFDVNMVSITKKTEEEKINDMNNKFDQLSEKLINKDTSIDLCDYEINIEGNEYYIPIINDDKNDIDINEEQINYFIHRLLRQGKQILIWNNNKNIYEIDIKNIKKQIKNFNKLKISLLEIIELIYKYNNSSKKIDLNKNFVANKVKKNIIISTIDNNINNEEIFFEQGQITLLDDKNKFFLCTNKTNKIIKTKTKNNLHSELFNNTLDKKINKVIALEQNKIFNK